MAMLFVPLMISQGLGLIRLKTLCIEAAIAAVALAALAAYSVWSSWPVEQIYIAGKAHTVAIVVPSAALFFYGAAGLFIAHALVEGGDCDRRFMAHYATHFDVAWKLAVQLALSAVFVGAFWLLLQLGAGLFALINLTFFRELIRHDWFGIPVTALATGAAIHLTDVRPQLVRGTRTLLLLLFSWLLPVIALIVAGFLLSLVFTGLAPLWGFGHATALLLATTAAVIVLINAAHQDGSAEHLPPRVLRYAGSLAAVLPVPLVLLAAWALMLRVEQYGWTADRVAAAACTLVAACYATG